MLKFLLLATVLGAVAAHGHKWVNRRDDEPSHHHKQHPTELSPNCTCTLSDSPKFQKFLTTSCGKRFLEKRQVCGSNNVTYANKCDFLNRQAEDLILGKRCHGACPCDYDHNTEHKKSHKLVIPEFGGRKDSIKPVCLNNGVTVSGWRASKEAMKAGSGLGVRCKGQCSDCQTAQIQCPVDWEKIKNEAEKSRPKPPNCVCSTSQQEPTKEHRHQICANDGNVYANMCELINNQTTQPKLGFRCFGKCPCKNRTEKVFQKSEQMPTATMNVTEEQNSIEGLNDSTELDLFRKTRNVEWDQEYHSRRHHRHHRRHYRNRSAVCLTNGETVRGWKDIFAAFAADPNLGIRCKGHCDWCLTHAKCPRFPRHKHAKDIRGHEKYRMFESGELQHGHRWGEEAQHHGWNHKCE